MSNNFMNKILDIFGMGDDVENIDSESDQDESFENGQIEVLSNYKKGKVVSIHSNSNAKVAVVQPTEYEEVTTLCDCMKNKKIIIVNLKKMEKNVAQRFVDFVGGAAYALDGDIQEVTPGVLLVTPNNVDVSSDLKNELSSRGLFSWTGK